MWSHYADRHRGAVIEFKCLPNLDRAFNVADKINYATSIPKFGTFDQWFDHATGRKPLDLRKLSEQYSFTKSMHLGVGKGVAVCSKEEVCGRQTIQISGNPA